MSVMRVVSLTLLVGAVPGLVAPPVETAGQHATASALDARVSAFLERSRDQWHDLNVPYEDGKVLHDLVVSKHFTRGLEIGTSTGHSGTWIAWAMSKTGGTLTTIEIDEGRHQQALQHFREAGIDAFVDARLGNAHDLVRELPGPWDFVFSDADKDWYTQYFKDVDGKLMPGGCFTAHNVLDPFSGITAFLDYVRARPNYRTDINRTSRSGISISCKESA